MRVLLLLVLAATAAADVDIETFYGRLIKFDRKYTTMIRTLCGWPEKLEEIAPVCRPAQGRFDVKQFEEARAAAKGLFGFKD